MNKLQTLVENKFSVVDSNNQIQITSSKPFKIKKGGTVVESHQVDGVYKLSAAGLIINGVLPFEVLNVNESANGKTLPLLSSIINKIEESKLQKLQPTNIVPFECLLKGESFVLENVEYVKCSSNSYTKARKIIQTGTPTVFEGTLDVQSQHKYNVLSPEQIRNIVAHMPEGLGEDDLFDHIHSILDDVPGFESPDSRDDVVDLIANAYNQGQGNLHEMCSSKKKMENEEQESKGKKEKDDEEEDDDDEDEEDEKDEKDDKKKSVKKEKDDEDDEDEEDEKDDKKKSKSMKKKD